MDEQCLLLDKKLNKMATEIKIVWKHITVIDKQQCVHVIREYIFLIKSIYVCTLESK